MYVCVCVSVLVYKLKDMSMCQHFSCYLSDGLNKIQQCFNVEETYTANIQHIQ